ncbi:MAG: carbohydrate kinase family protein [Acidobacteriaceae bacterium]|nr:carbohydrate kinase family protein [Acidobacteriaceae bacterium]
MSPACDVLGIGLNATDTLLLVKEFPAYAGKVAFSRELLSPGGQVATAIVTCARLGLRSRYIGTIGDDLRGDMQRESLEGTGVDTCGLIVRHGCPNQTAYIVIDERSGERTVFWQRAECLQLQAGDLRPSDIQASRLLHLDGYDVDAATYAAGIARKHRIPVSLDVDTVYPGFDSVLRNTDYLVAGSSWPSKWTGEDDCLEALLSIYREYRPTVTAMTLGSRGSLAFYEGAWYYSAAFEVPCVDTTGAGDVFHGAFCCAMLEGMAMEAALDFSNAAAALNCTSIGARGHVPLRQEVQQLLGDAKSAKVRRRFADEIVEQLASASADSAIRN